MNQALTNSSNHHFSYLVQSLPIALSQNTLVNRACIFLFLVCIPLLACDKSTDTAGMDSVEDSDQIDSSMMNSDMMPSLEDEAVETEIESSSTQIRFELGTLEGVIEDSEYGRVLSFKGVPYMQAPIGPLRFKPPQDLPAWEGVLEAKSFGPICPQRGDLVGESDRIDEDCLSLNMWLPLAEDEPNPNTDFPSRNSTPNETSGKAVMVWIHGGGFTQGAGSFPLYYGARLASRGDVIVITFNYRLGVFGFLNTHRLLQSPTTNTDEAMTILEAKEIGNFGIQDQVQVLTWVQKHIAAFGGDPKRVTIFGESAGGFSICGLLASPLSTGLFQQAIIESGGGCGGFKTLNNEPDNELEILAGNILEALGCGELSGEELHACLGDKSTDEILDSMEAGDESILGLVELGPSTDGVLITGRADQVLQEAETDHPNIMTGSNADEMTLFTYNQPMSLSLFENFVAGGFGLLANRVFELYPAENDQEARISYNNLLADLIFVCPTLKFASSLLNTDSNYTGQIWVYHFMHSLSSGVPAVLGATHALEIPFVFNNYDVEFFGATANEADRQLSDQMSDAWLSFAKRGNPSTDDIPWPSFRDSPETIANDTAIDEGQVMLWKVDPEVSPNPIRSGRCNELDQLRLLSGM